MSYGSTVKKRVETKVMSVPPCNYLFLLCKTLVASLSDSKLVGLPKRIYSSKTDLSVLLAYCHCPDTSWHDKSDCC